MSKVVRNWLFVFILSLLLGSTLALAKGKGKKSSDARPPGWDKGEKKGWQSDVPPGLEKKGKEARYENQLTQQNTLMLDKEIQDVFSCRDNDAGT